MSPTIRHTSRVSSEKLVELMFADSGDVFVGRLMNISETGMLVDSPVSKPRGTRLRFKFNQLAGKGKVMWTDGAGTCLGIDFVSLGRRERKMLSSLLEDSNT